MTPRDKSFSQIENVNKSMKCKHVKRFHIHKSGRFLKTFASSVYFCLLELILRRRLHHSICIPQHLKHIADLSNTNAVDCPHVDGLVQERRNSSAWVMELVFLALTFPSNCMEVCRVTAKTKLSLDWVGAFNWDSIDFRWMKCLESWIKAGVIVSGDTHRIVCRESRVQLMKIQYSKV